ncbi:hypothetical protein Tcan_00963, partial [Toxocara canis]
MQERCFSFLSDDEKFMQVPKAVAVDHFHTFSIQYLRSTILPSLRQFFTPLPLFQIERCSYLLELLLTYIFMLLYSLKDTPYRKMHKSCAVYVLLIKYNKVVV